MQLGATVQDQNGEAMSGVTVIWASGDSDVARVDGKGLVTAAGNGVASVTASAESVVGTAQATVDQQPAEVRVSPAADTLVALGDTIRLAAEAFDANGHRVGDAEFTWSSGDESVATVDGTGLVTGWGGGSVEVTVAESTAGLTGSVLLLVVDARGELVALYEALGGASWYRRDNWGTDAPLETWYGVTTDGQVGITALELGVNGLSGVLTPRIALLKSLETLDLHRNRLTGPIPSELGGLRNLTSLALDGNILVKSQTRVRPAGAGHGLRSGPAGGGSRTR